MSPSTALMNALTPTRSLRASINLGNPILANLDSAGLPVGVSIDLARGLALSLGVACELVVSDSAGKSVDIVNDDQADIGFFAIDPVRGHGVLFTAAYVLIEGSYLVRDASKLQRNEEVDSAAHRVTVGKGSAYDLYLTRALKSAQIVRAITSPAVVDTFLANGDDVAAGVRQQLESDSKRLPGLRLLPGRFMVIEQAMGVPKTRGEVAQAYVAAFVEEMKTTGFVAESLARHGIEGAAVAPSAGH
ncbi:MAG: transporter substrate-binding domain-containing protein [Polaromonas sp.]|nr:transporter substrate-binding domain-containing protein [Polaromonas sp.]